MDSGSPPRMRGKEHGMGRPQGGLLDHPRACGEKFEKRHDHVMRDRITPAHAGKRSGQRLALGGRQDHPRACGEKTGDNGPHLFAQGSPPRMRGKEQFHRPLQVLLRITPAHAGKRLKRSRSTVPHAAIVPLFPSVCNKPAGSDGSPAGHDAPPFLPLENVVPASPAYNLRSL